MSFLWPKTISGLAFTISILSFLTSFVYYKHTKSSSSEHSIGEWILALVGFSIGLVFWAFKYNLVVGSILYALAQIILYGLNLKAGIKKKIQLFFLVTLEAKIAILCIFICVILWIGYHVIAGVICFAIMIIVGLGLVNFSYLMR